MSWCLKSIRMPFVRKRHTRKLSHWAKRLLLFRGDGSRPVNKCKLRAGSHECCDSCTVAKIIIIRPEIRPSNCCYDTDPSSQLLSKFLHSFYWVYFKKEQKYQRSQASKLRTLLYILSKPLEGWRFWFNSSSVLFNEPSSSLLALYFTSREKPSLQRMTSHGFTTQRTRVIMRQAQRFSVAMTCPRRSGHSQSYAVSTVSLQFQPASRTRQVGHSAS